MTATFIILERKFYNQPLLLPIVPARSHEFVIVTRDCKSSDQKYPQVVPYDTFRSTTEVETTFII